MRFRRKLLQIRCSCNRAPRHLQLQKKGSKKKENFPREMSAFFFLHSALIEWRNVFYSVVFFFVDAIRIEQKIISAFVIMESFCFFFANSLPLHCALQCAVVRLPQNRKWNPFGICLKQRWNDSAVAFSATTTTATQREKATQQSSIQSTAPDCTGIQQISPALNTEPLLSLDGDAFRVCFLFSLLVQSQPDKSDL